MLNLIGFIASILEKFEQSRRWIETPLPRVTKPMMGSGGAQALGGMMMGTGGTMMAMGGMSTSMGGMQGAGGSMSAGGSPGARRRRGAHGRAVRSDRARPRR